MDRDLLKRIKQSLSYNPFTGDFTWRIRPSNRIQIGGIAGTVNPSHGYHQIRLDNKKWYSHRLAYVLMLGKLPDDQVDHLNGIRHDNRWINLRQADQGINSKNLRLPKRNTSGHIGVSWYKKRKTWETYIRVDGHLHHLGCYKNLNDAIAARTEADIFYGFNQNHGKKLA